MNKIIITTIAATLSLAAQTIDSGPRQLTVVPFASLGTPSDGTIVTCSDCAPVTPCAGSGSGAFAKRVGGVWQCTSGFNVPVVAGNPNQLGTTCTATASAAAMVTDGTTPGSIWFCAWDTSLAAVTSWYLLPSTLGTGPYTISATSSTPASGTAAARPACSGGTLGTLYYATDTFALTPCVAETAAWGAALNTSGKVAIILNTTTGSIDTYDSTSGLTTGRGNYRQVCSTFNGGGSALASGSSVGTSLDYRPPLQYGGTVVSWTVRVDAGTAGFRVWRTTSATANPTVSDTITTADLAIAANTLLTSTTMTNFTSSVAPTLAVGDSIAIQLNAAATATWAQFCLNYR